MPCFFASSVFLFRKRKGRRMTLATKIWKKTQRPLDRWNSAANSSCRFCVAAALWKATEGSTVGHQGSVMYVCSGRASTTEWGDSSLNALCHLDRLSWNMQHLAASCGCDLSRNFFVPLLIYLATFPLTYRVFQFLGCILEITVTWCDMSEPRWMRSLFQLTPSIGFFFWRRDWQSWWNYQGIQGFKPARQGTKWAMPMSFKFLVEEKSGRHPWKSNDSFRPVWGATWSELKWNARTLFFPPDPNHRDGIRVRYDANPDHCHQWTAQWSWAVSYAKTSWQIDRCFGIVFGRFKSFKSFKSFKIHWLRKIPSAPPFYLCPQWPPP